MKHRVLGQAGGGRRFAAVFDIGDDVLEHLQQLCEREAIASASITGLGGFGSATLGYFDMEAKRYEPIPIDEQVEVLSLIGNVTEYQGKPKIHAHCVVGHRDGRTSGGHLLEGRVRPTLELLICELGSTLQRTDRPEIGIPLIDI